MKKTINILIGISYSIFYIALPTIKPTINYLIMKIINYLIFSLLIIANISCSSDDDNNQSFDIIGNWSITEGHIEPTSISMDMGGMPVSIEISGSFVDISDDNRINFKDDNTFTSNTANILLEMNMVVMGIPQTQTFGASDIFGEGNWELNGNELKIENQNGTLIKYTIENLDGNSLELSSNIKDMDVPGGSNFMFEDMDIIVRIKFKKV